MERLCAQVQNSFMHKTNLKYFETNLENCILFVNEIIDGEELCEQSLLLFPFAMVIEKSLEILRVEVDILDVNDNSPSFPWSEFNQDISEVAVHGFGVNLY